MPCNSATTARTSSGTTTAGATAQIGVGLRRAGRGAVDQLPNPVNLDQFPGLKQVGRLAVPLLVEHRDGGDARQVGGAAQAVGGDDVGDANLGVDPLRPRLDRECGRGLGEALLQARDLGEDLSRLGVGQFQPLQVVGGDDQRGEALGVARLERGEQFLGEFGGGEVVPGVDDAVLIGVAAPLAAVDAEPAELVGLAVAVGVGSRGNSRRR